MMFHTQPNDKWQPFDFKLIEAYQMLQDETCPKCGQPVWLCRSDDPTIAWKRNESICYASRELEKQAWSRDHEAKDKPTAKDKKRWGLVEYATPYVPPNQEGTLPTREAFYKSLRIE